MSQATIKCPSCGQQVSLPAEACPCGFNFRAGQKPAPAPEAEASPSSKLHLILGGAAILALLALMLIFLLRAPSPPPPRLQAPAQASDGRGISPQSPIGKTQDAASKANERVQALKDTQAEIDSERAQ
jgi:hypothetical protein